MSVDLLTSEDAFLELIHTHFPNTSDHLKVGRGDDCAVLACPEDVVLTSDLFLEHTHFRRNYFSPAQIGHKALAVNLSDVAAMGARPLGFALNLMVPDNADLDRTFYNELLLGMARLADEYDAPLVGGDLSRSSLLGLSITAWGEPVTATPLLRNRARVGDIIFLSGKAGLARTGLMALEEMGRDALDMYPEACMAHLAPTPHVIQGMQLAISQQVHSLMDLSDGLARDLPRLIGPDHGAQLHFEEYAIHPEVALFCEDRAIDPLQHMVLGGEDYLLLGTAPATVGDILSATVHGVIPIGYVSDTPGLVVNNTPFTGAGFDHFG